MAEPDLPQKAPYVGKLNSVKACRIELAKVYRDARSGKIETSDGTRLAFRLVQLSKMIEAGDLEQRLQEVEKQIANLHPSANRHP